LNKPEPVVTPYGTVLAVNSDLKALIFSYADIGIVADWAECVPLPVEAFAEVLAPPAVSPAD
jgi:hypothetical protein